MLYNNYLPLEMFFAKKETFMEENTFDSEQENIFDPIEQSKPSFSEKQIELIADKISNKLLKEVELQLQS